MTAVNVYKQRPDNIQGQSPLHHAGLKELVGKGRAGAGIRLREKKLRGHLTLRGDAHDPAFVKGVNQAIGMELPVALTLVANGETSLQWMGPDEWLLIVPQGEEFATEQRLRDALAGQHIQVVNVIRRTGEEVWELVVRRSFADYIWLWLQDAGAEYGLAIEG